MRADIQLPLSGCPAEPERRLNPGNLHCQQASHVLRNHRVQRRRSEKLLDCQHPRNPDIVYFRRRHKDQQVCQSWQ